jgi:hypothetical protein
MERERREIEKSKRNQIRREHLQERTKVQRENRQRANGDKNANDQKSIKHYLFELILN